MSDLTSLPNDLPAPIDDGACDHLTGLSIPQMGLACTNGAQQRLSESGDRIVVYVYPMTGKPGVALPDGWESIPGARGCTPQSCSMRDHADDFNRHRVTVFGLSSQSTKKQIEAKSRLHLPFELLSDPTFQFAAELNLPTFMVGRDRFYKRMTLVLANGVIEKVFYPVFPPDQNASDVVKYLDGVS